MWKPIGKVAANFELMINETNWGGWNRGVNWQGKNRQDDKDLVGTAVGIEGDKIIKQICRYNRFNWHWNINRTYINNITKPHRDFGGEEPWDGKGNKKSSYNIVWEKTDNREEALKLAKLWRRFWIPMRDREFGQFFESAYGPLCDWKAGDIFYLPATEYHAGATVSFNDRYTMLVEGLSIDLNEKLRKLV